ncbi:MAG TPA: hypothetical protein VGM03_04415 [Phycisphaerae bacterium]|jgi:hypothetical protein
MGFTGILRGRCIELDQIPSFPEGTRVRVDVSVAASPRPGSPAAILGLVGTLSYDEAVAIIAASREPAERDIIRTL